MKIKNEDYKAFYKRMCVDLEFHDDTSHLLDEERLATALLAATETTNHPYARPALKLATEWFHGRRSMSERLGLFFDIMRMLEGIGDD